MMILDPISIATGGYIGIGPTPGDYCPLPLAIGSDGYIRFDVAPPDDPSLLGGGHGNVIFQPRPQTRDEPEQIDEVQLALIAVALIDDLYD